MVVAEIQAQVDLLLPQLQDVFVGFEEDKSIEAIIGSKITEIGETLSIAESCTGGRIAQAFTTNAGASKYFKGSIVSYATESKVNILKVSENMILQHILW